MGSADSVLDTETENSVNKVMESTKEQITGRMQQQCQELNGKWVSDPAELTGMSKLELEPNFLTTVFGGLDNFKNTVDSSYNMVAATPVSAGIVRSALVPRAGTTLLQAEKS